MLPQETLTSLEDRQQQLAELFIKESDPDTWPEMQDVQGRGDRYWFKKNANATLAMVCRIQGLFQQLLARQGVPDNPEVPAGADEEEIDRAVERATKAATAVLERAAKTARTKGK